MKLSSNPIVIRPGSNQLRTRFNSLTTRGDTQPMEESGGGDKDKRPGDHGDLRAEGDKPMIMGIAAPYGEWTTLYESGSLIEKEQYARGCFRTDVYDVMSTFNHNLDNVLGRVSAGTMRLIETDEGLKYEVDVNLEDPMAVGVYARVKRGEVKSASTWFRINKVDVKETELSAGKWQIEYTIQEATLYEAGAVTDGQYEKATSEARNLNILTEARESFKDFMNRLNCESFGDFIKRLGIEA